MTNSTYAKTAIPFILTNMSIPLLGAVDLAVVGRLENSTYISGVTTGITIFNTVYWIFGFLRVSTTGFVAQAYGRGSRDDGVKTLIRAFAIGLAAGLLILLLNKPFWSICYRFLVSDAAVGTQAYIYYKYLIWGVPLVFLSYVFTGYIMGMGLPGQAVFLQSIGNIVNIVLDVWFVMFLGMQVEGVAIATLISQALTFLCSVVLLIRQLDLRISDFQTPGLFRADDMKEMLSVNRDMMIRTGCLVLVSNLVVRYGGQFSADVLAANSVLSQICDFLDYGYEGLGNASSVFSGTAYGAKDSKLMKKVIRLNYIWSFGMVAVSMAALIFGGDLLISVFTDIPEVMEIARIYMPIIYLFPIAAVFGFSIYGIFSGATMPKAGRNAMIIATVLFVAVSKLLMPVYGNWGLWIARTVFFAARSLMLFPYMRWLRIPETKQA